MVWHRNNGHDNDEIIQNKFTAYLLSAVKRRRAKYIDDALRNQNLAELIERTVADEDNLFDVERVLDTPVYIRLQDEMLYQAIFELSERERYVFFNRVLEEKSLDELAADLGLSYKGVAAVYYRTVEKIRKKMRGGNLE